MRFVLMMALLAAASANAGVEDIRNYREYSPTFSSSGQPSKDEIRALGAAGFERVVYIAFTDSRGAIADEDDLVKAQMMDYVQVPVDWEAPQPADFYLVAGAMQAQPNKKTLLHCQANYRASAFAFLYRVIHENVPVAIAKSDMNDVWTPNETWTEFILQVLEEQGIAANCDGCDWTPDNH